MPRTTINGLEVVFDSPAELIEFIRLYSDNEGAAQPQPNAPNPTREAGEETVAPASHVFKSRNRTGYGHGKPVPRRRIPDQAFAALLKAIDNDDGVSRIQASLVFEPYGFVGPTPLSGAMKDVAHRIERAGFDVAEVIREVRRGNSRSMAAGPRFHEFCDWFAKQSPSLDFDAE